MNMNELFEIIKPGPLPEPTNCIGLFRTLKHEGLVDLIYGYDRLIGLVNFEGKGYEVQIRPIDAAKELEKERSQTSIALKELKIENEQIKQHLNQILEILNKGE
jgi:hypothetical protein